jgi:DNA-directed RNA polymerase subunit RPC12/RpoP
VNTRRAIGAISILVILASGSWLLYSYRSQPAAGETIPFTRPAVCAACGEAYVAKFGDAPAKCDRCGARALWHAMKCAEPGCGAFVPLIREGDGSAGPVACPKCGGTRLLEVGPNDLQ